MIFRSECDKRTIEFEEHDTANQMRIVNAWFDFLQNLMSEFQNKKS